MNEQILTKRQRRQALIKAAKRLQYREHHDFRPMASKYSCSAVWFESDHDLRREYGRLTGADKYPGGAYQNRYTKQTQLARQLAVLMFMEATT